MAAAAQLVALSAVAVVELAVGSLALCAPSSCSYNTDLKTPPATFRTSHTIPANLADLADLAQGLVPVLADIAEHTAVVVAAKLAFAVAVTLAGAVVVAVKVVVVVVVTVAVVDL